MAQICKLLYDESNKSLHFESATAIGSTLQEIIEDDKKYGKMVPYNGKYFTFRVMDWQSKTITNKQIIKGITLAWQQVEFEIPIDCVKAKDGEYADFKIYFRRTADDPNLTKNTIMYQFYPINNFNDPNRGVCVVNTDHHYTVHGDGVSMHTIDPVHYPPDTEVKGADIDFDAVYYHEGPGHGLGLQHSPHTGTKMFGNYSGMAEFTFDEDPPETIPRTVAKYGERKMLSQTKLRVRNWYRRRSDHY